MTVSSVAFRLYLLRNMMASIVSISLFLLCCTISVNGRWIDSTVSHTIAAPISHAFNLYSDLNQHPTWSPWLTDVDYDYQTGLSVWKLSKMGLTYSWRANNTRFDPPNTIQWESLDGLPNRGKVEFKSVQPRNHAVSVDVNGLATDSANKEVDIGLTHTAMVMTVSYDLPEAAALVLKGLGPIATNFINNILESDLSRFEERLLNDLKAQKVPKLVGVVV